VNRPTPEQYAWRIGGDTGISSEAIWHVMTGVSESKRWWSSVPHDPEDFGRCYRLLVLFPEWRGRLSEVAERHPTWIPFVAHWGEMERLYLRDLATGKSDELYELMQRLEGRGAAHA
jgi:hypothetical protein